MDAACMAYELWISNYHGYGCTGVGHGEDCATISVCEYRPKETDITFVGGFPLSWIKVGKIEMAVPGFVVHALASALNGMMPQPNPLEMKTVVPLISKTPCTAPILGSLSFFLKTRNSILKGNFICPP